MNVLVMQFNNYFNRIVKLESFVSAYLNLATKSQNIQNINLKPNDGIHTSIVVDMDEEWEPDYLIFYYENDSIVSRWYVIEVDFLRGHQFRLNLQRDVIADNLEAIKEADAMIERGPLSADSPYVFNEEGFSFNQIKKTEKLLKDESGDAWIVGYISSDTNDDATFVASTETSALYPEISSLGLTFEDDADPTKGATLEALQDAIVQAPTTNGSLFELYSSVLCFRLNYAGFIDERSYSTNMALFIENQTIGRLYDALGVFSSAVGDLNNTTLATIQSALGLQAYDKLESILSLDGKVVYSTDQDKYYQLSIYQSATQSSTRWIDQDLDFPLFSLLKSFAEAVAAVVDGVTFMNPEKYPLDLSVTTVKVRFTEVSKYGQIRTSLSPTRNHLTDAPYDIFAMRFTADNLALVQRISLTPVAEGKTRKIYDIQILPFCPFREFMLSDFEGGTLGVDYSEIEECVDEDNDTWDTVGMMIYPRTSSDSFIISSEDFAIVDFSQDDTAAQKKISNETRKYRLTSPNYASSFEFSVARNGGSVNSWKVDFTYRPYSPYIHVQPIFSGLYGSYNNDARGLILSGDFSIDIVSSEWVNYQIQNKNYQNIFNTQIKTLDQTHQIDQIQRAVGVGIGGIAAAGLTGAMTGNIAVAAGSAGMSLAKGVADFVLNEERFKIQRKQSIEMFEYQLGNVKALPNTLTKISSYNVNNKYFPVVEIFSSTDEEIESFAKYIEIFNFRIGVVAKIGDALAPRSKRYEYLKCKTIISPSIRGDSHLAEQIYKELDEGVFFDESTI